MTSTFASCPKANDTHRKWLAPCGTIGGHNNRQTNHLQNFVTPGPPSPGHNDRRQSIVVLPHFTRTEVPPSLLHAFSYGPAFITWLVARSPCNRFGQPLSDYFQQVSRTSSPPGQGFHQGSVHPSLDSCPSPCGVSGASATSHV